MIVCPYCGAGNIAGVDACERCSQSLTHAHLAAPKSHLEKCLLRDRLKSLRPAAPVTTVAADTSVGHVVRLLAERSIGCVLIVQDNTLLGIFSERDVVMKLDACAADWRTRPVSEFMTKAVQSLDADATVAFAVHRMNVGNYRHVPITDSEGRPVAIISIRDILRYLNENMG
ncbi:MAG: CBS domain-containing protein [Planctomycetes bacterium]|nr:CBS domain-containing protein [Planctomycetota bacterium]